MPRAAPPALGFIEAGFTLSWMVMSNSKTLFSPSRSTSGLPVIIINRCKKMPNILFQLVLFYSLPNTEAWPPAHLRQRAAISAALLLIPQGSLHQRVHKPS